jgi:hypothetical protein
LKTKKNRPIPINILKMKNKVKTKPREKKKNQKMTERLSYPNKKWNCKEANLEDLQERVDQCRDSSPT